MRSFRNFLFPVLLCVALFPSLATAQAQTDVRRQIAVLTQDMQAMQQQVGALRLEMEALQRENARLRSAVESARASAGAQSEVLAAVDVRIASLRREMVEADDANRRRIVTEVGEKIERLATETERSMKRLAGAINAQPSTVVPPTFEENYPKTGMPYTVQSGDTLSHLAKRYNSRVDWIRNANKIVDPARDLRVGKKIFIPQE